MDFCPVGLEEPDPDMICPLCRGGIDAYPDEYTHHRDVDGKWDVKCRKCGHSFTVEAEVTVRWRVVSG